MIRGVLLPLLPLVTVLGCIYGGWVARGMWERERYQRDVLEGRAPAPWEIGVPVYHVDDGEIERVGWSTHRPFAITSTDEISADGYARFGDGAVWPDTERGIFDDESGTYV